MGKDDNNRPTVLITGARGMLGRYVAAEFADSEITTLGLDESNGIVCDLTAETPVLPERAFDLVVHCAGTMEEHSALSLNLDGTRRLLSTLEGKEPKAFVYISSTEVYGRNDGELLDESTPVWASSEAGRSKALAEKEVEKFFAGKQTAVTILRPAMMFGDGVKGPAQRMFDAVVRGRYVHVRGDEARLSLVTALDTARAIRKICMRGGVYNVTDGTPHRRIDLAEAMSANAGSFKRMIVLPRKWANLFSRIGGSLPGLKEILSPELLKERSRNLTFSGEKLREAAGIDFHNTLDVIARRDKSYPYLED